ncbi:S6 family peptidase [Rahnella variigena]|uniref:Autotransporter outer membrane beta-barrel domain-containing protein n=1 Tax=Rahnella variigena TaxID=574964 RepID=A0ABX9PMV5_9GAMM|nr:S6 family peptidase [Rahnella variigena]RJT53533.1 autotransporter outer membrane beta-barrel domain-containing protein [Rahnella variigena]RKF66228.1 hypothetical protein CKQ54_22755 [Rahnella variigena]
MKHFGVTAFICTAFVCSKSYAGIMRHDVDVQNYRDFAENLGKFSAGVTNLPIYKTDGTLAGYLDFSMPDFGMVATYGYSTLVASSYVASARHNTGYKTLSFGNGAQYASVYTLINRNESADADVDFHLPRLNKVVTEAAPVETVEKSALRDADASRYSWYTRVGGGTQSQVSEDQTEQITLSGAYQWVSGGTINAATVTTPSSSLRATSYGPDNPLTSPLSIGTMAGDSGSPIMVYDELDKVWKIAGVLHGAFVTDQVYGTTSIWEYMPDNYIQDITAANTSADVEDIAGKGAVYWNNAAITQQDTAWSWSGLAQAYASVAPANATNDELDATKDLRFNGAGGLITLNAPINMGAGKLQFSNNYIVASASDVNATWAGGGVEVDAGKEVLWKVNGLANDALHKIGAGTLHINARGSNPGSLNVGEGTVILDQIADESGDKQAFSSVTLVSGRPTVVIEDSQQVSTSNIYFGYRGGRLDLNGNELTFKKINHTDSGAKLVNHSDELATLNITGYTPEDVSFNTFNGSNPNGTPGSIYVYNNPYTKETEYFQLKTSSYWYFPTDKSSTSTWAYLGTDANTAVNHRLNELNIQVFRGFLGETAEELTNGGMNVNVTPNNDTALTALTGGMNLNGTLYAGKGTTILSGQPVAHAGSVVIEDDWSTSLFKANKIHVAQGANFQIGEYAGVQADIVADESARVVFGYNDSELSDEKTWRCYAVIYKDDVSCSQPARDAASLSLLPASEVIGDVQLANNASLYLGKVNYQGAVTSPGMAVMTLDANANWIMTGNSNLNTLYAKSGAKLSTVQQGDWRAKNLTLNSLDATGLNLMLGVKPSTLESDKLIIKDSATGGNNLLDVSLLVDSTEPVKLKQDLVMIDAPAGTSHSYFGFANSYSGFSVYTPNYQVKDENDRVLWVLEHNDEGSEAIVDPETDAPITPPAADPTPDKGSETPEQADPTPDTGSETPEQADPTPDTGSETPEQADPTPDTGSETPEKADTTPDTGSEIPAQAGEEVPEEATSTSEAGKDKDEETTAVIEKEPTFSADDWFSIYDNQALIQNSRALMASRQYIFSEAVNQLHQRTDSLRTSSERSGSWATFQQGKGSFLGLNASQQTLTVGWDKQSNGQIFGLSASYTQGQVGNKGKENHRMTTAGVYYSLLSDSGWFLDAASRYMYLNQELSLDSSLGIIAQKRDSHMLAGSLRTGYQLGLAHDTIFISPFVGVSAGALSGYSLKGQDAEVGLSSGNPYFATSGVMVQKRGLGAELQNINIFASIEYQYSPGKNGSKTTLTDRQSTREYDAWSDNRYRSSIGLEGNINRNLSLNAKVDKSFGGEFKTDYSGQVGFSYNF